MLSNLMDERSKLGSIKEVIKNNTGYITVVLYELIIRFHLECCIQFWLFYLGKGTIEIEKNQRRVTKNTCYGELPCKERFKESGLLEIKRRYSISI